jgi:hypothetical protein
LPGRVRGRLARVLLGRARPDRDRQTAGLARRGGCWFRGHGIELHLGIEAEFRPARKAHPALLVTGIDDWASRLQAEGYPASFDDDFPGMRRFYTNDPHGNRLEFLEPLDAAPKTSDGASPAH